MTRTGDKATFNLLYRPWLEVKTRAGEHKRISPSAIADDDIVDIGMPRADFRGAAYQWLLGLLQTSVAPASHATWLDWREAPPSTQALTAAFEPFESAFDLDGDGPRFMQDIDPLADSAPSTVAGLLIDAPGANGIKNNTDFFVKRGRVDVLCPDCAVIALFTLQTNGPAGGAGFRTGLRGGGPLTTLVLPDEAESTLWQKLWLNVVPSPSLTTQG